MLQVNRNVERVEDSATQPSQLLHLALNFLRRQYVIVASAVALTTLLGIVYLMTTPPIFTASARMLMDTRKQQVMLPQQPMTWDYMEAAAVESQVEVLKSENIAQAVVKQNRLTEDPDIVGPGNDLWGTVRAAILGAPPPEVR